jgi:hypothetical protein
MLSVQYLNEVKDRLVFRLSQEFKNHDLITSIVEHHFSSLQQKVAPSPKIVTRTKEDLIRYFTFDSWLDKQRISKTAPLLKYSTLGRQRAQWKADKPILDEMIREGTVKVADRTRNSILYIYDPQKKFTKPC